MRRAFAFLAVAAALFAPAAAFAHPLGNFTVNRYAAVELSGDRVYIHYVLDLAEIPTFQEGDVVRRPDFAGRVGRDLVVELDGRRVGLVLVKHKLQERPGAGGLATLRFEAVYEAEAVPGGGTLVFHDTNFSGRIGWKEVVVRAERGAEIESTNVPATSVSNALRAYPKDLLQSPLAVASARVTFEPGEAAGAAPRIGGEGAPSRAAGGFESLIAAERLSASLILLSLLISAFWGAVHALTPGHGKAIVAGYLVGSRGRPRHALLLGLIVTLTHTAGVFALGLVTLLLSRFVVPERLYPWVTVVSGLLVVVVGASVLRSRLRHRHAHRHAHDHDHHDHGFTRRGLVGVGVAAGLLPCPSALVVLLSAIALHRVGLGLALILAFSVGLAATITAIGLLAVLARRAFTRISLDGRLVRALPAASALFILAVGIGITVNALPEVL
jgi:nickel/cobalt transporter (NicO) family protein